MRVNPAAQQRPLSVIAAEIRATWKDVNYAAVPYLEAMADLNLITDAYFNDSAELVVCTFLSNTRSWSGEDAHRIKNELRAMVGLPLAKAPKPKAPAADPDAKARERAQRKADAAVVKAAVVRAIFCPFTGDVLDMRRAVVIDTGTRQFVCTGKHWDSVKDSFTEHLGDAMSQVKVYDGRELYTPAGRVR